MAKKVLVVDDEKLIVKGIRFSLEQDGMEVDCAYDGEEALNMPFFRKRTCFSFLE
jgi:DNA-binding response OmpR family regulator